MQKETYCNNFCATKTSKGRSYRVENLWSDQKIYIEADLASAISGESKEDPYLISILLAVIKLIRIEGTVKTSVRKTRGTPPDKPSNAELYNSFVDILSKYEAIELIEKFQEMKWHELKPIITSQEALQAFETFEN